MPQPAEVRAAAARGAAHWTAASDEIERAIHAILTGRRGKPLASVVRSATRRLEAAAARWAATSLPAVYVLGGEVSAALLGTRVRSGEFAVEIAEAVDEAVAEARTVTAGLRRDAARFVAPDGLPVLTPAEVARLAPGELADLLGSTAGHVRYSDGSLRTLADHGDMLCRTRASTVYNRGTLDIARAFGVTTVRIADGADCGLGSHDGSPKAHGLELPVAEAYGVLLAHPRCQRSFTVVAGARRRTPERAVPDGPADGGFRAIEPRGRKPRATGPGRAARTPRAARKARRARAARR